MHAKPAVLGIAGWKNSGKTTLVVKLVAELSRRGLRVATVKHAHHDFEPDREGKDSWRHRAAGAAEVAVVSSGRWAIFHELRGAPEPSFGEVLARLSPADLVLVEGYKQEPIPKIEVRRAAGRGGPELAAADPQVIAVATDSGPGGERGRLPSFSLDDATAIADFIVDRFQLAKR